jgi:hypothetical protein
MEVHHMGVHLLLNSYVCTTDIYWDIVLLKKLKPLWNPDRDFTTEYGLNSNPSTPPRIQIMHWQRVALQEAT